MPDPSRKRPTNQLGSRAGRWPAIFVHGRLRWLHRLPLAVSWHATVSTVPRFQGKGQTVRPGIQETGMGQFEQDWLELGRRVACSLHYQHPRNLRLLQAAKTEPRLATASTTMATHSSLESSSQLDQRCDERSPAVPALAGCVQAKPG
jgi:hypothetical protein